MCRALVQTITASLLVVVVAFLAGLRPALAHGLGESYNVPLPICLYLYGAGAMVLISFVPISLFAGRE